MFIFICTPQPTVQWGTRGAVYEGKVTGAWSRPCTSI